MCLIFCDSYMPSRIVKTDRANTVLPYRKSLSLLRKPASVNIE